MKDDIINALVKVYDANIEKKNKKPMNKIKVTKVSRISLINRIIQSL